MPIDQDRKTQIALGNAFLAGEKIAGIKFRHNSHVRCEDADGTFEGWIVSVGPFEPEPLYTIERSDGGGDEEVLESNVELIYDPHEPSNKKEG
jgi:hypothetical protein